MASEATEREITKWKLWGVSKLLEMNAPMVLEDGETPATLELILEPFGCFAKDQAISLLEEARSSLKEMDTKFVIYGALTYQNLFNPCKLSDDGANIPFETGDLFKTFGKRANRGYELYDQAAQAQARLDTIRKICTLPVDDFIEKFAPTHMLSYIASTRSTHTHGSDTSKPETRAFETSLLYSDHLWNSRPESAMTLFRLIKHTSHQDYRESSMGWDDERKIEEMKDADMRYLIVRLQGGRLPLPEERCNSSDNIDQTVVGFLSFMITQEEDEDVVYIYEIHISEHFRRYGLGRHLFQAVEHIGKATNIKKTMLTVFKSNKSARKWYAARGYEEDEISPRPRKLRGGRSIQADYEILSKRLEEPESTNKKPKV